jgi:thymidylate synthase
MTNFPTANEAFKYFFRKIMLEGSIQDGTKLLFNESMKLYYPNDNEIDVPWRRWDKSYADLEYEWYKTGDRNPAMVEERAKIWKGIKDEKGEVNSNYGYWWNRNGQLEKMIKLLREKPTTRRAVLVHYDVDQVDHYEKDTPCNIVLNFYIWNHTLNLHVFARSIDLVYGFCNDQYCFSKLMMEVADAVEVDLGFMFYTITNLHIYEKHWYINERDASNISEKKRHK